MLYVRGIISSVFSILYVNKNLKHVVYDGVPEGCMKKLVLRGFQATLLICIQFTIVKYLSLIYIGIAQNITPLVTIVMSYYMTGEVLKTSDIVMIFVTFAGVSLITIGFNYDTASKNTHGQVPLFAQVGAFSIPFVLAFGNILMSTMKGLHENTVSLYINPTLAVVMYITMRQQGYDSSIFSTFDWLDWLLTVFFSINVVLVQTLKFMALQNEKPAKLGHFQYMGSVYQLFFDVCLLGAVFMPMQWMGLAIMFGAYFFKVLWDFNSKKDDKYTNPSQSK